MRRQISDLDNENENKSEEVKELKSLITQIKPTLPRPISVVQPDYPRKAYDRRVQGTVLLRVLISVSGKVLDASIVKSPGVGHLLDQAALDAIKKWRFSPATVSGKPIESWHEVPIDFVLK
jgi:protein TonB